MHIVCLIYSKISMYVTEIPKLSASCLFNAMKVYSRASKHLPWFNNATEYDKLLIMTSEVENRKFPITCEGSINVISYCMPCDQPVTSHSFCKFASFALMKSSLNVLLNISFCIPRRKKQVWNDMKVRIYIKCSHKSTKHIWLWNSGVVTFTIVQIFGEKSSLVNRNRHKKVACVKAGHANSLCHPAESCLV